MHNCYIAGTGDIQLERDRDYSASEQPATWQSAGDGSRSCGGKDCTAASSSSLSLKSKKSVSYPPVHVKKTWVRFSFKGPKRLYFLECCGILLIACMCRRFQCTFSTQMWKEGFFVKSGYRQFCCCARRRVFPSEAVFCHFGKRCAAMHELAVVFRSF